MFAPYPLSFFVEANIGFVIGAIFQCGKWDFL
jgi:hypothetical protein